MLAENLLGYSLKLYLTLHSIRLIMSRESLVAAHMKHINIWLVVLLHVSHHVDQNDLLPPSSVPWLANISTKKQANKDKNIDKI